MKVEWCERVVLLFALRFCRERTADKRETDTIKTVSIDHLTTLVVQDRSETQEPNCYICTGCPNKNA